MLLEQQQSGSVIYVHGDDLISMNRSEGTTSYFHYDGQMSVRQLTAAGASVTDTYTYDAFGVLLESTGNTPNAFRYAGEQYDPNMGFYYLRARYYAQALGRFISMDSHPGTPCDPASLHKYLYAHANPVMFRDPSGNTAISEYLGTILCVAFKVACLVAYISCYLFSLLALIALTVTAVGAALGLIFFLVTGVAQALLQAVGALASGQWTKYFVKPMKDNIKLVKDMILSGLAFGPATYTALALTCKKGLLACLIYQAVFCAFTPPV